MKYCARTFAALAAALVAGTPVVTQAAPDNTLGMAMMAAQVDVIGTLLAGSGTTGSVSHPSTGIYDIQFDRDISSCFHVVQVDNSVGGQALVSPINSQGTYVRVVGLDYTGSLKNVGFYLLVFCAK